jgi:VacB/RNase II family 3'-5' exoribonuclease
MNAERHHDLAEIARRAMRDRGLEPDFPPAALAEAERLSPNLHDGDPAIRDLRDRLWSSIDNDDTRDLDQLEVAEALPGGAIRVQVAIADVEDLVRPGSAIDEHARKNTTSVYTAARIFAMLPERLSTGITSLNDGEDRLAIVIEMTVAADGSVAGSDVYPARVHNRCKLAYDAVAAWLDGQGPMPPRMAAVPGIAEQVKLQDEAAARLRRLRHERGALDLETRESRAVVADGKVTDLKEERDNRAKNLIEDFMIAANGVTAQFLTGHGLPSIRRVVRTPARWPRIVELAAAHGDKLPAEPDARALNDFLDRRRQADPEAFPEVSLAVVKLLGPGEYVLDPPDGDPPGHFGLAVKDYTHATAPNRRYPDLITQRLVKAAFGRRPSPYSDAELEELARHCTLQEDAANRVERQVRKSAAAQLFQSRIGDSFDSVVTGASEKGTWVRTYGHPVVEGRLERGFEGRAGGAPGRGGGVWSPLDRGLKQFLMERQC